MKIRSQLIAAALLATLLAAGTAAAQDTLRVCQPFPRQSFQDVTLTLPVPQFPLPECTILDANIRLTLSVDGRHFGENTGNCLAGGCSYIDTTRVSFLLNDLDGSPLDTANMFTCQGTMTSYDGVFDFGGTSGYSVPFAWTPFNNFLMTYPDLSIFDNPVSLVIDGTAFSHLIGTGNGSFNVSTFVQATLCAEYIYACVVPVRPTTWSAIKSLIQQPE